MLPHPARAHCSATAALPATDPSVGRGIHRDPTRLPDALRRQTQISLALRLADSYSQFSLVDLTFDTDCAADISSPLVVPHPAKNPAATPAVRNTFPRLFDDDVRYPMTVMAGDPAPDPVPATYPSSNDGDAGDDYSDTPCIIDMSSSTSSKIFASQPATPTAAASPCTLPPLDGCVAPRQPQILFIRRTSKGARTADEPDRCVVAETASNVTDASKLSDHHHFLCRALSHDLVLMSLDAPSVIDQVPSTYTWVSTIRSMMLPSACTAK
jgi:hypothetical protein